MNLVQALQFYPLLTGIVALAFWSGVLSARLRTAEDKIKRLEVGEDGEGASRTAISDRLIKLETAVGKDTEHITKVLESLGRELRGLSRQVATLVTHGPSRVGVANFLDTQADG